MNKLRLGSLRIRQLALVLGLAAVSLAYASMSSGTTLMAAEELGRRCYMMEFNPAFCQTIIKRWEDATGRKAEKIGG